MPLWCWQFWSGTKIGWRRVSRLSTIVVVVELGFDASTSAWGSRVKVTGSKKVGMGIHAYKDSIFFWEIHVYALCCSRFWTCPLWYAIRLDLQLVFFLKEGCLFPHNSWWFLLAKKGWIRLMMSQCNDVLMTMQRLYMSCFCCKTAKRFLLVLVLLLLIIIFRSLVSRMLRDFGRKINRKL